MNCLKGDTMPNKQLKVVGLFSGVGGIELGFEQAGFEIIWANEIDTNACKTYQANHNHKLIENDIHNIQVSEVPDCDVIVAGFPCQAFSIAGYQKGFEDERGEVFFQLARIIKGKRPKFIFIENVKNLLRHDKGNTFRVISETLESIGYYLKSFVLNAFEYGNIPQNRERVYVVGCLSKSFIENLESLEPIPLTKNLDDIIDFETKVATKFYYTKESCKFYNELAKKIVRQDRVYQWRRVYVRENKNGLCPTLTANMGTGGHNVPLILTKHGIRKLTPTECFKMQGYPDTFVIPEEISQTQRYKQAGNSVVVPVVKRLAELIKNTEIKLQKHKTPIAKIMQLQNY